MPGRAKRFLLTCGDDWMTGEPCTTWRRRRRGNQGQSRRRITKMPGSWIRMRSLGGIRMDASLV
eukprot:9591869-Alexandrium_andersonii.AAC.1